jgi:hypothetical protein
MPCCVEGLVVNHKRNYRIYREERLRLKRRRPGKVKRERLSLPLPAAAGPALVCDHGPEFSSKALFEWAKDHSVQLCFIQPGKPTQNASVESFNGKLRFELLNREIFDTLKEAEVIIESWRRHYNTVRPHSALRWRPPAPEAFAPADPPLQDPFGKLGISSPNSISGVGTTNGG